MRVGLRSIVANSRESNSTSPNQSHQGIRPFCSMCQPNRLLVGTFLWRLLSIWGPRFSHFWWPQFRFPYKSPPEAINPQDKFLHTSICFLCNPSSQTCLSVWFQLHNRLRFEFYFDFCFSNFICGIWRFPLTFLLS